MKSKGAVMSCAGLLAAVLALGLGGATPTRTGDPEAEYPHGDYQDDCTMCHGPEGWRPAAISASFDHSRLGMPLEGSHAKTACLACHTSLEFDRADPACVSCHLDVHQNELGPDCARCHTPRSFIDRTEMIRQHLTTRFPLRGNHRAVDCEDCHTPSGQGGLQYVNTATECEACHLDSYLATSDPDHQASGLPRTCEQCHSTRGWIPAGFNHAALAPGTQCVGCHLADYQATSEPNHQAVGYPQECELCHSTTRWVPAAFDGLNHDALYFPIYSGKHRGEWDRCSDCHMVPGDFSQFNCLDCHEHDDPIETAEKHQGVSGYDYESQACYACHPQGDN